MGIRNIIKMKLLRKYFSFLVFGTMGSLMIEEQEGGGNEKLFNIYTETYIFSESPTSSA